MLLDHVKEKKTRNTNEEEFNQCDEENVTQEESELELETEAKPITDEETDEVLEMYRKMLHKLFNMSNV